MLKIVCDYCDEESFFIEHDQQPTNCEHCNTPFQGRVVERIDDPKSQEKESTNKQEILDGLILTYQKSGEKIDIIHALEIVIGRENIGAEILGKIAQVSRAHFKIECVDNRYLVTDLDSLNGTFTGITKIDCRANPRQVLEENSLLYIGREPFLVNIKVKMGEPIQEQNHSSNTIVEESSMEEEELTKVFKCMNCGNTVLGHTDICPHCNSFGTVEVIDS